MHNILLNIGENAIEITITDKIEERNFREV